MAYIKSRLYGRAALNKIPLTAGFELTPVCNFACKMCYVRKTPAEVAACGGLQSLDFWLDVARQARDAGTLFPLLTGGETFLYPQLQPLYEALCDMGMEVSINSNGSCITPDTVAWLRRRPPVRLNITLYGGSNETYARLCGDPKGFDRVCSGIELLAKNNLRFKFNCSLTPHNCGDLAEMRRFAKEYGMGLRLATYMSPPFRRTGEPGDFQDRLTAKQAAYYQVENDFHQLPPEQFAATARKMARYEEPDAAQWTRAESGPGRSMGCLAGRCSYWVDWQGNLSGCGMMDLPRVSLKTHRLTEGWEEIVSWTQNLQYSPACANCINRSLCFSCAALVHNETGGFEARPTYLCEKTKYTAMYYQEFLKKIPEPLRAVTREDDFPASDPCGLEEDLA